MPNAVITVRGIPEVQKTLAAFPRLLVLRCFHKALSRAAGVMEEELRARCPESDYSTSSEEYGHLVENISSQITLDTQNRGGRARIGFGNKSFVALWIEYGHRMVTHKGRVVGSVQSHPFIRQSFEAAADRALEAFIEEVQNFMSSADLRAA